MKNLVTVSLLLISVCAFAQKQPAADSKEYQDMKAKGKFENPTQTPVQKNYPVAIDRTQYKKTGQTNSSQTMSAQSLSSQSSVCTVENPTGDPSYSTLAPNDDTSSSLITLPFSFSFYGDSYNQVYVNNNGNISFQQSYTTYSSTGFPAAGYNMIAPFWADVDTRVPTGEPTGSYGIVSYKSEAHRFTVIWYKVGYFAFHNNKTNTFKLVITDGTDPIIGIGNNVGFFYADMQWTTGDFSGGQNGLGGIPATVGINKGGGNNSCFFYQIGRFGQSGSAYDPFSTNSGVDYLDNKCFFFDASVIDDVTVSFSVSNQLCGANFVPLITNPQNCKIQSYSWDFGDGSSSTQSNPTHAYSSDGSYTAKLTVSYTCGACVSKTATFESQVLYNTSATAGVTVDFANRDFFCTTSFKPLTANPNSCQLNSVTWDFGDGTPTSSEPSLFHSFSQPGTYNVKLSMIFTCGACAPITIIREKQVVHDPQSVFKDTLVEVSTSIKNQVLNSSVSTFSDVWPLDQYNQQLTQVSPFLNGSRGVWRNEGQYVYNTERKQTPQTDISTEGTYTMENFNWEHAALNAVPNWIKANSMTQYSSYGYEVENKDVLDVYSSALYDYGGHLPSANGLNMKYCEMAFTSFEYLDQKSSGNWKFGNQPIPSYTQYDVETGYQNMAVIKTNLKNLESVQMVDVSASGFSFGSVALSSYFRLNYLNNDELVCKQAHPSTKDWSIIVLKKAPFPLIWRGKIRIANQQQSIVSPDLDNTFSHSGKTSLKVTSEKIFEQGLLKLDSGKTYLISAWVSVNDPNLTTPKLADNLGIEVTIKDRKNAVVSVPFIQPQGPIIDGWQQVRGSFVCPVNQSKVELKFKPGSKGTAWYDDLRLHPEKGNMKSYVYNLDDYRLQAILDEENFASFYYYDKAGNLKLVKKETEGGIKTISENVTYQVERN